MFSGPRLQKNPMHTRAHLTVVVLVMISNTVRGDESNPRSPSTPQFNRDIRPVLSAACFQCHGPDKANRKKRLRLDEEKGVRRVFEPGSLEESKGWHRIISKDPDEVMPPPDSHRKLEPREIELVRRWIEQGAEWQGHWSFIAPRKPTLPAVENREWVRRPIDAFVLARLEQEGLSTSPDADRERTLRRVTLDLTGLPPTIAEIDAFLTDERVASAVGAGQRPGLSCAARPDQQCLEALARVASGFGDRTWYRPPLTQSRPLRRVWSTGCFGFD